MKPEEYQIITNNLEHILQFYKLGSLGAVVEQGGFVKRYMHKYPELAEDHIELLWTIDSLIVGACNAGHSPP